MGIDITALDAILMSQKTVCKKDRMFDASVQLIVL
jgi:hypothetical protein